jgi:hypothetical protein
LNFSVAGVSIDGNYSAILNTQLAVRSAVPKSFIESEDDGRKKRYIENDYCYPKSEGKTAAVNVKAGSVKNDKNCYTIDE